MYFHKTLSDETYIALHYRNCNHVVPVGQFITEGLESIQIIPFQELHDILIKEYEDTANLELYKKAKEMLKISNGEIELEF
jgi:hypothetical protein